MSDQNRRQSDRLAGNPAPFAHGLPPPSRNVPANADASVVSDDLSSSTGGYLSTTNEYFSSSGSTQPNGNVYNDPHISVSSASTDADPHNRHHGDFQPRGGFNFPPNLPPMDMFGQRRPMHAPSPVPNFNPQGHPHPPPMMYPPPFPSPPPPIPPAPLPQQQYITPTQLNIRLQAIEEQQQRAMHQLEESMQHRMDRNVQTIADTIAQQIAQLRPATAQPAPVDLLDLTAPASSAPPPPPPAAPATSQPPPAPSIPRPPPVVHFAPPPAPSVPAAPPPTATVPPAPTYAAVTASTATPSSSMVSADMAALLTATKDNKQLYFNTFKPSTMDYVNWKATCALQCRHHPKHKEMTERAPDGKTVTFKSSLTDDQNEALFLMAWQAIGSTEQEKFADRVNVAEANGLALWALLDKTYVDIDKTISNKERLQAKYQSLKRENNESFEAFAIRFVKKQKELKLNAVDFSRDPETVAHKFLRALNVPLLKEQVVMHLAQYRHWYEDGATVSDLAKTAMTHLKQYEYVTGSKVIPSFNSKEPSTEKSSEKKQEKKKTNTEPTPRRTSDETKVNSLMAALSNARDKQQYLQKIKTDDNATFKSLEMKHACTNLNLYNIWRNIANGNNAPPTNNTTTGNRNDNNNANGNGATQPTAAARRAAQQAQTDAISAQVQAVLRDALGEQSNKLLEQMQNMGGPSSATGQPDEETQVEDHNDNNTGVVGYSHSTVECPIDFQSLLSTIQPLCQALILVRTKLASLSSTPPSSSPTPPVIPIPSKPIHIMAECKYMATASRVNSTTSRTIVADSGATDDMTADLALFDSITMFDSSSTSPQPHVLLGDETTKLPIAGYGFMHYKMGQYVLRRKALYVPALGPTSLLSIKQHMQHIGNYFHAENNTATLAFPTFSIDLDVGTEISHAISPVSSNQHYDYNEEKAQNIIPDLNPQAKVYKVASEHVHTYIPPSHHQLQFHEKVLFKKLIPQAHLPVRATSGAIGFDVVCPRNHLIKPGTTAIIPTGLSSAFPQGMYMRIASRSSFAKQNVNVVAGVIDSDYRGEIGVMMRNDGNLPFEIPAGTRMAQFIFEKASIPYIELADDLPHTVRNMGGFGSTGSKANKCTSVFRLDKNYVIMLNNSNPWRPTARRVRQPLIEPSLEPTDTPSEEEIDKDNLNPITTHKMNEKASTPLDTVLDPSFQPIPTSVDNDTSPPTTAPPEPTPTPLPVTEVNSGTPKRVVLSREALHRAIGYTNATMLLKNMNKLGKGNVQIQNLPQAHHLDPGEVASIRSPNKNKVPLQPPPKFSDIWHMDIGFGPCTAIGGVRYTLLLVDKYSKYKFVYGLKNLNDSILNAMKKFITDVGVKPKLIRTDFDYKLMGGDVASFLTDEKVRIESAPPKRQDENGLVERHWQTVVAMARNWLTSAQLPAKYWFFALKRACEVVNLMPFKRDGQVTTPFELIYKQKVDYRNLLPMFSIAYIRQERVQGQHKNKWKSKTLKCILVGKCSRSDSLLFYHPPSRQTLSCADGYRFDTVTPAGPHFGETYDGDFIFNTKSDVEDIHRPPSHQENEVCYVPDENNPNTYHRSIILSIPINEDTEPYTIQEVDSGAIRELPTETILDHDPTAPIQDPQTANLPVPSLPWIKHDAKVTLYLPHIMSQPKRGHLQCTSTSDGNKWTFIPGRNKTNDPISLPNFTTLASSLVDNKKLFKGWIRLNHALTARRVQLTSNIIAHSIINRKVSARDLIVKEAPSSLLQHYKMHPDDKATWDESYRQEYEGLVNIDTWEVISEEEYQESKHLFGSLLPTMAVAVIKPDGDGNADRAKYRIVALGNLDPHNWTKDEVFAPVLSQLELRFLTALAAKNKCIPKSGDITQAFCQSYLPTGEDYICRPPAGCPLTPKGTYWRLKKTLYGLKRSPRHFYNLASRTLKEIGLQQHPFSPCIFYGSIIEGEPPIYVGIYVDDFIYFSQSREVEEKFEKEFGSKIPMDFNGDITYFLGINFKCKRHPDGNVSIFLSQQAFIENLVETAGLSGRAVNTPHTPYRSGLPVDKIPILDLPEHEQIRTTHLLRQYVGSLNWLSTSTRPDISTITNMLAQYANSKASPGHIDQAKRIIKYLKATKTYGIMFSSRNCDKLSSFVKFPITNDCVTALSDANWGPQDQSKPSPTNKDELELFKSRSISGYILWLCGPLHWSSKRQTITARSSAEAEIYATDECTKQLIHLSYLIEGLNITDSIMPSPTTIYNDNAACVLWSKATTTKGLRHIQIRENAIREAIASDFISVQHIEGKVNLADLFTKEDRDAEHFINVRNQIMTSLEDFSHTNNVIPEKHARRSSFSLSHLSELSQGGVKLGVGPSLISLTLT